MTSLGRRDFFSVMPALIAAVSRVDITNNHAQGAAARAAPRGFGDAGRDAQVDASNAQGEFTNREAPADSAETAQGDSTKPAADPLQNPAIIGRQKSVVDSADNDPAVIGLERKLRCTCGCSHDIFTCRTTDAECTIAPALHQEIVAKLKGGATVEEVQQAMVAQYGQKMLMAPEKRGFNLLGYLLPAVVITIVAAVLLAVLNRRAAAVAAKAPKATPEPLRADPDELERALREIDT